MSSDSESEKSESPEPKEETAQKASQLKHVASRPEKEEDPGASEKTEAQIAMEAARKKHQEQEEQWLKEYQEMRAQERQREQEELLQLKARQAERRKEREEEEKILAEKRRVMEEKRKEEEEEIRKKREEEKAIRQAESEKRRAQLKDIMGGYMGLKPSNEPNFVIEKREKAQPVSKEKSTEEIAREKEETVARRLKALNLSGLSGPALKERAIELHKKILKLETERYETEDRIKRQEYDLKELTERQKLVQKQKLMKLGIDPTSDEAKFPPKVQVSSKYERRTDRRSYNDRRYMFEQIIERGGELPPTLPEGEETVAEEVEETSTEA